MTNFRFSPSCHCCAGCLQFLDYFDRANNTVVSGWTEVSGAWQILDNKLREDGNSGAKIIADRAGTTLSFWVTATIPAIIQDAIYILISNYKDSSNYFSATYQFTQSGGVDYLTIKLYKAGTLLREQTWGFSGMIGEIANIYSCLTAENFSACITFDNFPTVIKCRCYLAPELYADGFKVGLGNGSSIAIDYDNFSFFETQYTNPSILCPTCPPICGCMCYGGDSLCEDGTQNLYFTIESDCLQLDGLSGILEYHEDLITPPYHYWEWVDTDDDTIIHSIRLECDPDNVAGGWQAYLISSETNSASCYLIFPNSSPTFGQCIPLLLTFEGEIEVVLPEGCTGVYGCEDGDIVTITITCVPT